MRYRPPGSQILKDGVSINLRGLLAACDAASVKHPTEKMIRRHVRQMGTAISSGNQPFLPDDFPVSSDVRQIPQHDIAFSKACITIPKSLIPDDFFECLYTSKHTHNYYEHYI